MPAALLGDAHGVYRIRIVGNSGAGKSTAARNVGALLGLPVIHLDELHWRPGWTPRAGDEMRRLTRATMREHAARGWVMDGNYFSVLGDTETFAAATDVIWLDPPFLLYFPRLLWRTFARLCRFGPPCAPGCDEDWREVFFSRNSIILWCITHHSSVRRRYEGMWEPVENGGKWRRLGGWGGDFQQWWNGLELIAKSR